MGGTEALSEPVFLREFILRNTISISLYSIAVFPCAVIFALMLNEVRNLRFKRGVQMISYAPHFISTVVVVSMLQIFMQRSNGLINNVIAMLGGERIDFLSIPQYFSIGPYFPI